MYLPDPDFVHTFAGNPLDRAQHLRKDDAALSTLRHAKDSQYILFHQLKVATDAQGNLAWLSRARLNSEQLGEAQMSIELGQEVFLGLANGRGHFAVDLILPKHSQVPESLQPIAKFTDCRQAVSCLSQAQGGIVSQARAALDWHQRNPYCAQCGQPTKASRGGQIRHCQSCAKHTFPRTDPVAIMLIQDDAQGDFCLLGKSQGRMAQSNFYSALAGFVDQGESLEEAVRREVMEEAGIRVGQVSYHSSQPWPFPSSLMIGCHGVALNKNIVIDPEEMADVAWFDRPSVLAAIAGENPDLRIPGPGAIAYHLIKAWALKEAATPQP